MLLINYHLLTKAFVTPTQLDNDYMDSYSSYSSVAKSATATAMVKGAIFNDLMIQASCKVSQPRMAPARDMKASAGLPIMPFMPLFYTRSIKLKFSKFTTFSWLM